MLCDYLKLNETEMPLYVAGADGMRYCMNNHKEIAEIYKNDFEWIFSELDSMNYPKTELRKIFVEAKKYTDNMQFDAFLKFFISQHSGLIRMIAENQGMNSKLDTRFEQFESFGNSINKEVNCTASLTGLITYIINSASTNFDRDFSIICMGPR